ncbi:right-handed parallel beta-helix repeat-containing protein [Candidatus Bathyarchaeota archaeon]|nr:right-handed parallel beta-helix repeat-containing protein [Candidatus Bathyarchaeota archaeon]
MAKKVKLKSKLPLVMILILTAVLFNFPKVEAESQTIVVPDDYSTIQEAVSNAADGDTVLVKNGIYQVDENTTIVISKTLSLVGEDPANTTILGASSTYDENGIAIRLAAPNIAISRFTIANFRVAIALVNYNAEPYPSGCKIIGNNIVNNSEGIRSQRNDLFISQNNITKNNAGITGYNTENVVITANNISANEYGINIGICRNITINENQISDNKGGVELYYYGPHFVYSNKIINNSWGIKFAEGCGNATVYGNSLTQNGVGVVLLIFPNAGDVVVSGVGNTVFGNLFINNTKQVSQEERSFNYPDTTSMGTDIVSWDNGTIGNYWDDYSGLDENDDELGDAPYIIDENNKDNYPLMNSLGLDAIPEFPSFILVLPITFTVSISLLIIFKKKNKK